MGRLIRALQSLVKLYILAKRHCPVCVSAAQNRADYDKGRGSQVLGILEGGVLLDDKGVLDEPRDMLLAEDVLAAAHQVRLAHLLQSVLPPRALITNVVHLPDNGSRSARSAEGVTRLQEH